MNRREVQDAIDAGGGMLRLEPAWVPRTFMIPGRRLRLHPDDLYALGGHRGGINERWFSSTTNADNGPGTPPDEGLSYVRSNGRRFLLKDAVDAAGDLLIGAKTMAREGGWNLLCKFFDNLGPIPHHMHQSEEQAKLVGRRGKPEAYYFPAQYNQIFNNFPFTFMGLEPGTTKAAVRRCLEQWVCYGTGYYSAKELTVLPRRGAVLTDAAAYGLIVVQGHGLFGTLTVSAPTMIRYGDVTEDELFVTEDAARAGIRIENHS